MAEGFGGVVVLLNHEPGSLSCKRQEGLTLKSDQGNRMCPLWFTENSILDKQGFQLTSF